MPEVHTRRGAHALLGGLRSEHDRYKRSVSFIPLDQLRLQEDLRRFLCLRCAGFLEQVTFEIVTAYLEMKASGPVLSFATSRFTNAPNLNAAAFVKLVGRFGNERERAFEEFLATSSRRETLVNLMEVRNDVAHGKYQGGRKLDPEQYIRLSEEIYDWLVETFLGDSLEVRGEDGSVATGHESIPS